MRIRERSLGLLRRPSTMVPTKMLGFVIAMLRWGPRSRLSPNTRRYWTDGEIPLTATVPPAAQAPIYLVDELAEYQ